MMSLVSMVVGVCLMTLSKDVGHLDIFVIITIILFTGGFAFDVSKSRQLKNYAVPVFAGYLFRVFLLFYDVYSGDPLHLPLVGGELSSDPLGFYNAAVSYSAGNRISYGGVFSKVLGAVFKITGPSRLWGELIVLLFSIGTIIVFVKILEELELSKRSKLKGTYLICFLPNYAFLSVVLRRETMITFFVALSTKYFIRWFLNKSGEKAFVLSVVFALLSSLFHGATGMIVASYLLVHIIYSPKLRSYNLEIKNIIGGIFFIIVIMFIYGRYGTTFFGKIESKLSSGTLSIVRDAGGSSYARYVGDARTPIRMVIYAIPRFLYYMFSPFPWQWRGIGDIITFVLSSCVYLVIIMHSIQYVKNSTKDDESRKLLISLLIITLVTAAIFSWGVTNTGTATRHRDKFIVMFAIMYALSEKARLPIRFRKQRL